MPGGISSRQYVTTVEVVECVHSIIAYIMTTELECIIEVGSRWLLSCFVGQNEFVSLTCLFVVLKHCWLGMCSQLNRETRPAAMPMRRVPQTQRVADTYATEFQRPSSDENASSLDSHAYTRHMRFYDDDRSNRHFNDNEEEQQKSRRSHNEDDNDDDGVASVAAFQLRPGRFGGMSSQSSYRRRGLNSLLSGDAYRRTDADERVICSVRDCDHPRSSETSVQWRGPTVRLGRLGDKGVFGGGPDTLLGAVSGSREAVTSTFAPEHTTTSVNRGGGERAMSSDGESVLSTLKDWRRRQKNSQLRDCAGLLMLPEWLRGTDTLTEANSNETDVDGADEAPCRASQ